MTLRALLLGRSLFLFGVGVGRRPRNLVTCRLDDLGKELLEALLEDPGVLLPLGEAELLGDILKEHPGGEDVLLITPVAIEDGADGLGRDLSAADLIQRGAITTRLGAADAQVVGDVREGMGELGLRRAHDHPLEAVPGRPHRLRGSPFGDEVPADHPLDGRIHLEVHEEPRHRTGGGLLEAATDEGERLSDDLILRPVLQSPASVRDLFGEADHAEHDLVHVLYHSEGVGRRDHAFSLLLEADGDGPTIQDRDLATEVTHDLVVSALVRLLLVDLDLSLVVEDTGEAIHLVGALGGEADALVPADVVLDGEDLEPGSVLAVLQLLLHDPVPPVDQFHRSETQRHGQKLALVFALERLVVDLPEEHAGEGHTSAPPTVDGVRHDGWHQAARGDTRGGPTELNRLRTRLSGQGDLRLDADPFVTGGDEVGEVVLLEHEVPAVVAFLHDDRSLEPAHRGEAEVHHQGDSELVGVHEGVLLDGLDALTQADPPTVLATRLGGQHPRRDLDGPFHNGRDGRTGGGVDERGTGLLSAVGHVDSLYHAFTWICLMVLGFKELWPFDQRRSLSRNSYFVNIFKHFVRL